jgi:hypothetical protein
MQPEHQAVAEKMIDCIWNVYPLLANYMYPRCFYGRPCVLTPDNILNLQFPYKNSTTECEFPAYARVKDQLLEKTKGRLEK